MPRTRKVSTRRANRSRPAPRTGADKGKAQVPAESSLSQMTSTVRALAEKMLEVGSSAAGAAKPFLDASSAVAAFRGAKALGEATGVLRALAPKPEQRSAWAKTGDRLRKLREKSGMTIQELGQAINLKDPELLEVAEKGKIALPFEIILRLAAVLGRNDPIGFTMQFARTANPELWQTLEALGIGKLVVQSAREREFANLYRANDAARSLSDKEFGEVLAFVRAAFEMALAFRARKR